MPEITKNKDGVDVIKFTDEETIDCCERYLKTLSEEAKDRWAELLSNDPDAEYANKFAYNARIHLINELGITPKDLKIK